MTTSESDTLAWRIEENITRQGRYFVATPAEMARIGNEEEAHRLAQAHSWLLVVHLGGENYEFFEAIRSPHQALY